MVRVNVSVGEKRGSDELLSSAFANGPSTMSSSTPSTANGNDSSKKFKGDRSPCAPSRVLHIRKIPIEVTEAEVISLGLPFGKVTNLLMLKGKNQAFVEMASEDAAITMVNYYTTATPHLRNQPVFIQYSNHRELKTDNLPNQARAQVALQAVNAMHSGNMTLAGSASASEGPLMPGQSPVLRIIVENLFYPVSLEVLHQIFSKFGTVLKIITFTKNNQFQALLQYADPMNAHHARLFFVCLTGAPGIISSPYAGAAGFAPAMGFPQAAGVYGDVHRVKILFNKKENSLIQMADPTQAQLGLSMQTVPGALGHLTIPASAVAGRMAMHSLAHTAMHSVLLVSNLNPDSISPQGLFILFGVYGDVHRVKILFNKKENSLIQMADPTQAQLAMSHLNGQRLHGRVIRVTISKHQMVQLPREGQEDQGLTKDFSNSPLHRFKKPGSKNFQNIFPPSATLHLSNIPPSITDDDLKNLFASTGCAVKAFKFFQKDRKMALIQLGSVEEAIQALIDLHNHDLGENHHLRVSFSKSTI
ncbi:UNVERIFIED_CONTAM: hypothetical protein FKN15_046215 [Acipenser sinensis]